MKKALTVSIISIVYVSLLIPSAFAQSEQIEQFVEEGIESMVEGFTDDLDFSDPNLLNATEEETGELMDSGLEMVGSSIDLLKSAHHFATSLINFLSPYSIPDLIVWIIGGAIAMILLLSILKRIAIHIVILTVITLLVVAVLVYFYY